MAREISSSVQGVIPDLSERQSHAQQSGTSENEPTTPHRMTRRAGTAAMAGAILVALGSLSYRTRWESTEIRKGRTHSTGTTTDGIGQWAFLTFPLGSLAIGLLLVVARLLTQPRRFVARHGRRVGTVLILIAAASLAIASAHAASYWWPLLAERATGTSVTSTETGTYAMELAYIAWGLPIVTVAGAIGSLACVAFAVLLARSNHENDGRLLPTPRDHPSTGGSASTSTPISGRPGS